MVWVTGRGGRALQVARVLEIMGPEWDLRVVTATNAAIRADIEAGERVARMMGWYAIPKECFPGGGRVGFTAHEGGAVAERLLAEPGVRDVTGEYPAVQAGPERRAG